MLRLCEIMGLLPNEMAEVAGFVMAIISFGVFMSMCMFKALMTAVDLFWAGVDFIGKLVRKHFPNVRKKEDAQ